MTRDDKAVVQVGDKVRSADFRSEFYRKIGTVEAVRSGTVKVRYPGGGWESTGPQWFTWVSGER